MSGASIKKLEEETQKKLKPVLKEKPILFDHKFNRPQG